MSPLIWLVTDSGIKSLGVSEQLHYQGTATFDASTEDRITTSPPMFYDRVLCPVVYSFFIIHLIQSSFNKSSVSKLFGNGVGYVDGSRFIFGLVPITSFMEPS